MSAEPEPGAEPAPRESIAGVLGVGLGLALIAVCGLVLFRLGPEPLDARAELERDFELGALPLGFELGDAYRFSTGETVVELTDGRELELEVEEELATSEPEPDAPDEDVAEAPDEDAPDAQAAPNEERVDWTALPEGEAGTPPARIFLVRYSASGVQQALSRQFRNLDWLEIADIEAMGGRAAVEGGRLRWGEYAADYVRERRFVPNPPRFQDSLRVNLALPDRYWIAFAYWPEGMPGSKEPVEAVLEALGARPVEDDSDSI